MFAKFMHSSGLLYSCVNLTSSSNIQNGFPTQLTNLMLKSAFVSRLINWASGDYLVDALELGSLGGNSQITKNLGLSNLDKPSVISSGLDKSFSIINLKYFHHCDLCARVVNGCKQRVKTRNISSVKFIGHFVSRAMLKLDNWRFMSSDTIATT